MLADPRDTDAQLREHRAGCRECTLYSDQLLQFESRLERALRMAVPVQPESATHTEASMNAPAPADVVPLRAKSSRSSVYRKGWLAMAASVLLAVVVAAALWVAAPGPSLAADVVTHMQGEPGAWRRTETPVPDSALLDVLRDSHLRLGAGAGMVSYASSCEFRGHHVPHLVMQTESGPVTVMVLVHEQVARPSQFDEQGYRGVIVPVAGHGSLAVLTRGRATDIKTVENIAGRVLDSIAWTR
jgi:hypothetical protein